VLLQPIGLWGVSRGAGCCQKIQTKNSSKNSIKNAKIKNQVIRGYVGDRSAPPVLDGALGQAFNVLGQGYQRPLELATHRLQNMAAVLSRCALLFFYFCWFSRWQGAG
jgi:hypothetical protein